MPPTRREFLAATSALSLSSLIGLQGCQSPDHIGQPAGTDDITVDFENKGDWDFPVIDALMPFGHGVKSGDPLHDRVIIWTRISIPDPRGWLQNNPQGITSVPVRWAVATDKTFTQMIASGDTSTNQATDWTVKVDVDQLQPNTTYWFAFAALGKTSIVGRTKTAPHPDANNNQVRIAQTSCSKYWGGYFSMYGRIADRNDVDLLLHCGDHIYNKQSPNRGAMRMPPGVEEDYDHIDVRDWARPEEVGRRYALYCTDPDLLRAHAALPFVIMPDQHDTQEKDDRGIYGGDGVSHTDGAEQFHLWNASRPLAADGSGVFSADVRTNLNLNAPRGAAARLFYKHLPWGKLADITTIDMRRNQEDDKNNAFLSDAHWAFLETQIETHANRGVAWHIWGNGVCMTQLRTSADLSVFPESIRNEFFSYQEDATGLPDTYPGWSTDDASRQRLYALFRQHGVNNIVLSGDIHGEFISELIENNQAPAYVRNTGNGTLGTPVGVEIMTGMSSSGSDEDLAAAGYENAHGRKPGMDPEFRDTWIPGAQGPTDALEAALIANNPNLLYAEWSDDAYAILHLSADKATCELWRVDKRVENAPEDLMYQMELTPNVMNVQEVGSPSATSGEQQAEPIGTPAAANGDSLA